MRIGRRPDVEIADVRPALPTEWDRYWAADGLVSFELSRTWAELLQATTHPTRRPDAQVVSFSDGASVLLPVAVQPVARGLLRMRDHTGWLAEGPVDSRHIEALATHVRKSGPLVRWDLDPEFVGRLGGSVRGGELRFEETRIIILRNDFDTLFASWSKSTRASINKARKSGIVVSRASSQEDWDGYFAAYEDTLTRWGTETVGTPYSKEFFEAARKVGEPYIDLWIAKHDDEVIAGAFNLVSQFRITGFHASAREEWMHLSPMSL